MDRAYISISAHDISAASGVELLGQLAHKLPFAIDPAQRAAWEYQIRHLRTLAIDLPSVHFFMEFLIPRMGRRADLVVLQNGIIFVIEYKLGARRFDRSSIDQVYGYGLDLKHFHETIHDRRIVPILVATEAPGGLAQELVWDDDDLARPLRVNASDLASAISHACRAWKAAAIDPAKWIAGRYHPTPTIVEAAQALYRGHDVEEISRSEAGAENLGRTSDYVAQAIDVAKLQRKKIICFITGVPGSGKTLAGLNLATARQRAHSEEHAVFLSGNGPLVAVLREALALDAVARAREAGKSASKAKEDRRASAFIQNIHHFRDEALTSDAAPNDKVAIFDEAQRAWDVDQTSKFMQKKRGQLGFSMSEPEFLLSVMDRHPDWCGIICLVGGGQEINTGEAGIEEWLRAVERSFPQWEVHAPESLSRRTELRRLNIAPDLHLATSIRSFRAEKLSDFVAHLIDGDADAAAQVCQDLPKYPLLMTRNLPNARKWLRERRRGNERAGLLASSNAARLKSHGIFVKAKIEPEKWFLAPSDDVRSADALEDAATEFDVQGLELDWACLCWDANFRRASNAWQALQFKGTRWQAVNEATRRAYVANSYRVLLTRARQGLIVLCLKEMQKIQLARPMCMMAFIASYEYADFRNLKID
jgi:hypothetical protein